MPTYGMAYVRAQDVSPPCHKIPQEPLEKKMEIEMEERIGGGLKDTRKNE